MLKAELERITALLDEAAEGPDRTAAYDAISTAERDEQDGETRQALHEAAVTLLRSQHDGSLLPTVRQLLATIRPRP